MEDLESTFETVRYAVDGAVATITLNRPDVANAQNSAADRRTGCRLRPGRRRRRGPRRHSRCGGQALLLRPRPQGAGGRGRRRPVGGRRETPEGKFEHEKTMYFERCLRIHDFRKPTIAAVQGSCVAAGLMLAAMCDLIVAADDAVFSNPVLRLTGAGVELLVEPWELGIRKAKEFLLTGDTIDAQEAWRLGLVNRVVPRDELERGRVSWPREWPWCPRSPRRRSRTRSTTPAPSWANGTRSSTTSWPTTGCTTRRRR